MVKKGILLIVGCSTCLMLLFSAGNAYAIATSFSGAGLDWNNVSFEGLFLSWDEKSSLSEAEANDDGGFDSDEDSLGDWGDSGALAIVDNAIGIAITGYLNEDYEDVIVELTGAQTDGSSIQYASSWAYADRCGRFEALTSGTLTIEIDYLLLQYLETEFQDEHASGWSFAGLDLYNFETEDFDEDGAELDNEVWNGEGDFWDDEDTLSVEVYFNKGDEGDFYAWVENKAEAAIVPEPASLSLLGLGLLGLFGVRRKRS